MAIAAASTVGVGVRVGVGGVGRDVVWAGEGQVSRGAIAPSGTDNAPCSFSSSGFKNTLLVLSSLSVATRASLAVSTSVAGVDFVGVVAGE